MTCLLYYKDIVVNIFIMMSSDESGEYTATEGAKQVLQEATILAIQLNQTYVTSEDILPNQVGALSFEAHSIR